jgi:PAS domain S-box-containing protein
MSAAYTGKIDARSPSTAMGQSELAHIANLAPQMVWICTPDGNNIYFNQRWVDYTGLTLEQSFGAGWGKPFHLDNRTAAQNGWQHAVETGTEYRVERRIRAEDGRYRYF